MEKSTFSLRYNLIWEGHQWGVVNRVFSTMTADFAGGFLNYWTLSSVCLKYVNTPHPPVYKICCESSWMSQTDRLGSTLSQSVYNPLQPVCCFQKLIELNPFPFQTSTWWSYDYLCVWFLSWWIHHLFKSTLDVYVLEQDAFSLLDPCRSFAIRATGVYCWTSSCTMQSGMVWLLYSVHVWIMLSVFLPSFFLFVFAALVISEGCMLKIFFFWLS